MKKSTWLLLIMGLLAVCSIGVYAEHVHDWQDTYNYVKEDADNHRHYFCCYDCGEQKYELEPHDFLDIGTDKIDENKHKHHYQCSICGVKLNVTEGHKWERLSFGDRQYDDKRHYAYYQCSLCLEERYVLKKHVFEEIPVGHVYGTENICYAEYKCQDCSRIIKVAEEHSWKNYPTDAPKYSSPEYHFKYEHRKCTKCQYEVYKSPYEKHNLGLHKTTYKGKPALYWGCDICHYNYDGYVYPKTRTSKDSIKLSQYMTKTIPLPHTDKIKSIKITSGKNKIKVKKLSYNKIKIIPKKKGTAKFKITTSVGLVFTNTVKVKKR